MNVQKLAETLVLLAHKSKSDALIMRSGQPRNLMIIALWMKDFSFDNMVEFFRNTVCGFPDNRTGSNTIYSIEDAGLGAFSVFFTQSPSFLTFQTAMQQKKGKNNAQSLFGILNIPCHNQIKFFHQQI